MFVTAARLAKLHPRDRADFATTARLVSCLVTESLTRAVYIPLEGFTSYATGFSVVFTNAASSSSACSASDVLAIIPLIGPPIFKNDDSISADGREKEIGLLDPLDMVPLVLTIGSGACQQLLDREVGEYEKLQDAIMKALSGYEWSFGLPEKLSNCASPIPIWEHFATSLGLERSVIQGISNEFSNSVKWQQYSYEHPPRAPSFSSPSIEWEQSIVEGHPTHPMHKLRLFMPPIPDFDPGTYNLDYPRLRLIALPKEKLHILYDFEKHTQPILDAMSKNASQRIFVPEGHIAVPVHELQLFHIRDKFKEAVIYPEEFSLSSLAQQSIRSLIVPDAYRNLSLKLGVGIKLTSATRTLLPATAYFGPHFSTKVVPFLALDPSIVTLANELASVSYDHPDEDVAKHCGAIIREAYELTGEDKGERLIVCTALTECGHSGEGGDVPPAIRVFGLDTEEKRLQWLSKFSRMLFDAFLPCMMRDGVAFECHPQNCVARFDMGTRELLGFVIRDLGGVKVHPETLKASTGVDLDAPPGHFVIAKDLDAVYTRMYHCLIHNHLQQLIRVLGLHYNGRGWKVVREHLEDLVPREHPLFAAWLSPDRRTLSSKTFMRSRISGMCNFPLHSPFQNLLHIPTRTHSRPQAVTTRLKWYQPLLHALLLFGSTVVRILLRLNVRLFAIVKSDRLPGLEDTAPRRQKSE